MALTDHELFGIYPAIFDSLTLAHISNVDAQHGVQKMIVMPGGLVDPALVLEVNRDPQVMITGHDLGAILTAVSPLLGLSVASAWKVQYQQKADGGTFTGSGANVLLSGAKGKLILDSISAQQDEQNPASCALKFYPLWDGTTVDGSGNALPVTVSAGQNLSGTPSTANVYKLGAVVFEGTTLKGVQSAKVNFGTGYTTTRGDGEKAARIGTIDKREPSIEVDIHNLTLLSTNTHGLKQASSGVDVYFRNHLYADAATNHVKISMGAGAYETTPAGTAADGKVMTKLIMTATKPSAAEIIVVTVGVAMP